jgi:hypothetical protein
MTSGQVDVTMPPEIIDDGDEHARYREQTPHGAEGLVIH